MISIEKEKSLDDSIKQVNEIHRNLIGKIIAELCQEFIIEDPRPTLKQARQNYSWFTTDTKGNSLSEPIPEYIEAVIKEEYEASIRVWKHNIKFTVLKDCEGVFIS